MTTILLDIAKGMIALALVLLLFWLAAQALTIIYAFMGDDIGFLGLLPTILVLSYIFGNAISAQKNFTW
ncbi:hypothetical protein CIK05_11950 [Bdellovibrio sp. qaytius]|nr:hypothetical protein CIK05_11950 [Bdellovibrio sp. qaytius]